MHRETPKVLDWICYRWWNTCTGHGGSAPGGNSNMPTLAKVVVVPGTSIKRKTIISFNFNLTLHNGGSYRYLS